MLEKNVGQVIPTDDRFRGYRGSVLMSRIDDRIFGVEFHWFEHLSARERGDAVQAEGHLRMSVVRAVGLAAHPTRTREAAERKVAFLLLAGARLYAHIEGDAHRDHRGTVPMLAAAADAEVRRWDLKLSQAGGGKPRVGPSDGEPSPALRRSLEFNAAPRSLAEAVADANVMHADSHTLAAEGDLHGARGANYEILASLLHSLAIPATSTADLELKLSVIDDWSFYLQPAHLTCPMLEAVVGAECERLDRSVDLESLLARTPPKEGS